METAFAKVKRIGKQLEEISEQMVYDHSETILNKYANLQQQYEDLGGYTYHSDMMTVFTKFGFQEEDLKREVATFSGGQKTRLAFVKLLLRKPDILLLDEPTNHLDIETIEWLEGYVKRYPKAVVLVSHDRMFLDDVVDVVYELEYGVMRRYPGNYTNYVNTKKSDVEQQNQRMRANKKKYSTWKNSLRNSVIRKIKQLLRRVKSNT